MKKQIVLGTMPMSRQLNKESSVELLKHFVKLSTELDTALLYPGWDRMGDTEKLLGEVFDEAKDADWTKDLKIACKANVFFF